MSLLIPPTKSLPSARAIPGGGQAAGGGAPPPGSMRGGAEGPGRSPGSGRAKGPPQLSLWAGQNSPLTFPAPFQGFPLTSLLDDRAGLSFICILL